MGPNYEEFSTARLFHHDYLQQGLFFISLRPFPMDVSLPRKGANETNTILAHVS